MTNLPQQFSNYVSSLDQIKAAARNMLSELIDEDAGPETVAVMMETFRRSAMSCETGDEADRLKVMSCFAMLGIGITLETLIFGEYADE